MQVEIKRHRVEQTWTERRKPVTDANGTVTGWEDTNVTRTNEDNGHIAKLPAGSTLDAHTMRSELTYCQDGSIPGVKP
jgi:hypothetical protein